MSRLELFLFGSPHVKRDGKPVKMERRKAIALTAYLAVTSESHTREALATLFWPNSGQAHGRAALRKVIAVLRRTLGEEWLEVDREILALKRDPGFWLDVDRFHSCLAGCQAHDHPKDEACPACLDSLAKAVALSRDDFMASFSLRDTLEFDDWQRLQSEKLRDELDNALERLVRGHCARREFRAAIDYARRWLALNPLHEPAHRRLMHLYAQIGQRDTALQQYEECVNVLEQELGILPQEETICLYQALLENRELPVVDAIYPSPFVCPHNLPLQPAPFVGREKELAQVGELLGEPSCRLLTLMGTGGIGKTRLALEAALQAAVEGSGVFSHGVYFVPLAPLSSADFIVPTIATSLKFSFHGSTDPKEQLFNYLREKEVLLLLDNFEHILDGTGLLVEMLSSVPGVKLLVTSRQRLNLQWEWPLEILGLEFPRNGKAVPIEEYSAVQLFLQSARRAHPAFSLPEEERPFVAHICQSLEGVPLAIRMAAAWVESFSCREIAQAIKDNLGLLATSLQDVPRRHRSMRAAFDHSWNLLSEEERGVFRRLSVFRGGFRRETAEQVAGASLSLLSALMHKSFLHRNSAGRYEVLEVLRQYADEKLEEVPREKNRIHDLHCAYYAEFLYQQENHLRGREEGETLQRIGVEMENVRTAWQWAVRHNKQTEVHKSLESLYTFYDRKDRFQEGNMALAEAAKKLERVYDTENESEQNECLLLGKILVRQGWFCVHLGHFEKAKELIQKSISLFRYLDVPREMALALNYLGIVTVYVENRDEAEQLFRKSLAMSRESGDRWLTGAILGNFGIYVRKLGKFTEARQLFHEALVTCKEVGDQQGMAINLANLSGVACMLKDYAEAKQLLEKSLVLHKENGSQRGIAQVLSTLAYVSGEQGEYRDAKELYCKSLEIFKEIDDRREIANCLNGLGSTLYRIKDYNESQGYFGQALEMAANIQAIPDVLKALVGIATLLPHKNRTEQAVELAAYAFNHPAIYEEAKGRAKQLLSELEPQLSPQTFSMAQEKGKTRELEYYIRAYETGELRA